MKEAAPLHPGTKMDQEPTPGLAGSSQGSCVPLQPGTRQVWREAHPADVEPTEPPQTRVARVDVGSEPPDLGSELLDPSVPTAQGWGAAQTDGAPPPGAYTADELKAERWQEQGDTHQIFF